MTPQQVLMILEGMLSTDATSTAGKQALGTFIEAVKVSLRDPDVRGESDLQFELADNVGNAGVAVDTAATHLLAVLVDQDSADAERDFIAILDSDTGGSFLGDSVVPNALVALLQPPAAGTDNTSEYWGMVFIQPLVLATGLSVDVDGRDGTAPAANDVRIWFLYRN